MAYGWGMGAGAANDQPAISRRMPETPAILEVQGIRADEVKIQGSVWTQNLLEDDFKALAQEVQLWRSMSLSAGAKDHDLAFALTSGISAKDGFARDDPDFLPCFQAFMQCFDNTDPVDSEAGYRLPSKARVYRNAIWNGSANRRFFSSRTGYIGTCPPGTEKGDAVYLLLGSRLPFVLRRQGEYWRLIGQAHVQGIMEVSWNIYCNELL